MLRGALALGVAAVFTAHASAASVSLPINEVFAGPSPAGPAPYALLNFDDGGTPGSVAMTVDVVGLSAGELVTDLLFNVAGGAAGLSLAVDPSGDYVVEDSFATSNGRSGVGGALFDFEIELADGGELGPGESLTAMITGGDKAAAAFIAGTNGSSPLYAQVRVIGAGEGATKLTNTSGDVLPPDGPDGPDSPDPIPTPGAAVAGAVLLGGMAWRSRRRRFAPMGGHLH